MKLILFFLLLSISAISQKIDITGDDNVFVFDTNGIITIRYEQEGQIKTRLDTISGRVVFDDGYQFPLIDEGIRIDTIQSCYGEVPCPDNMWGCLVYHTGWTDRRKGTAYYVGGDLIETKKVIHFIPNK